MTRTASCSRISVPLIRENLRRYWAIPALGFLIYFLSGVFPILLRYHSLNSFASTIEDMLTNMHPFFMGVHIALPIISAVMLFRYMQGSGTMTIAHSLPFSRMKLYWTNVVTGFIMSLGPMVLTGVILLIIRKPAYRRYDWSITHGVVPEDAFTAEAIGQWMFQSALIIVVIFAVAVFAGIVTGNSLLHFVMAGVFNFLIPAIFAVLTLYCEQYLYGFNTSGEWFTFCAILSPWLCAIIESDLFFTAGPLVLYILTFVVMTFASAALYKKRKLERVSDPLVFAILRPVIIYIAAFFVMTLMSFYFVALGSEDGFRVIGYIVGAVLGFIIVSMIIYKTLKIFNLASLKSLGIFAVIMILVICSFNFDFYGFEDRLPNTNKVVSAYASGISDLDRTYGGSDTLYTEENVQHVADLHSYILENRDMINAYQYDAYRRHISMNFRYEMENGRTMSRRYSVPYSLAVASPSLKAIYESEEFKNNNSLMKVLPDQLKYVEVSASYKDDGYKVLDGAVDIRQLLKCIQDDYKDRTFEQMTSWNFTRCSIGFAYYPLDEVGNIDRENEHWMNIEIDGHYARTLAWLAAHEETADIPVDVDDVAYIMVEERRIYDGDPMYVYDSGLGAIPEYVGDMSVDGPVVMYETSADVTTAVVKVDKEALIAGEVTGIPETSAGCLVLTDPSQVKTVLDEACSFEPNMPVYYSATIFLKEKPGYDGYMNTILLHFTEEKAPDFVKAHFAK